MLSVYVQVSFGGFVSSTTVCGIPIPYGWFRRNHMLFIQNNTVPCYKMTIKKTVVCALLNVLFHTNTAHVFSNV